MFLTAYHFDGQLDELLESYDRMNEMFPPGSFDLHACIERDGGITVFDACPDRQTAEAFSTSTQFKGTIESVGLPAPKVELVGQIHRALVLGGQVVG